MSKGKDLVKNSLIILLGKASTRFITFLLLPLYTALLSHHEYGLADLITTYVTLLVPLVSIELENGAFRFLLEAGGNKEKEGDILYNLFRMYLNITVVYTIGFFVINYFFHIPYAEYVYSRVLCGYLCSLLLQIARGYRDNMGYSIASFLSGVLTVITNIILIRYMGWGAKGILLGNTIGVAAGGIYLAFRLNIFSRIKGQKDEELQKQLIKYCVPLIPNTVCWWIINAADKSIVSFFMSIAKNGIYSVSVKFPSAVASVFYMFNLSWQESASLHLHDDDADEFFTAVFDRILKLFGSLCIMLIACMPILFPIFVKGDYGEAYRYIPAAMVGSLLNCMANMYNGVYVAAKNTKAMARTSLIAGIINVAVDFLTIKWIGIFATSLSTSVAYLWMILYRQKDVQKYVNVSYKPKTVMAVAALFASATVCYYTGNMYIQAAGMIMCGAACVYINKDMVSAFLRTTKNKISAIRKK